jgi:hypothetical protein
MSGFLAFLNGSTIIHLYVYGNMKKKEGCQNGIMVHGKTNGVMWDYSENYENTRYRKNGLSGFGHD